MRLRAMRADEWSAVAEVIFESTNRWYERAGKGAIFRGEAASCRLFCEVYEDLDPGCCVVAEDEPLGRLAGSCFYHPRETHVSLGIMNVHPDYFGRGVASRLLKFITDFADAQGKPVRLVSSAMNLDSFSLYTRAGFVPRAVFQDILFPVPAQGLGPIDPRVREAQTEDVARMAALEEQVSGIRRAKDFAYFIENRRGIWHVSVLDDGHGAIAGFLCSVNHPASNMLGPGVMKTEQAATALIRAELDRYRGKSPVFLVPSDQPGLVQQVYSWGGRNCEIHFGQVRGSFEPFRGIVMPTFIPETA
ncbi:MAG TPA: GNAT family N-acetyltransferase [Tepidisphaeraceae bacterium]|jgi:GNAT superfamily N-acetyltransferase|nr:GNAT family N-acetyltransferase [Tepidisphaeraceae bacterium]